MRIPHYTNNNYVLFTYKRDSNTKIVFPVIGYIEKMFITKALNLTYVDSTDFYISYNATQLNKRFNIHVGYRERGVIPCDRFELMVACEPKEATHVKFVRGKLALAHAETTWHGIVKWANDRELYVDNSLLPMGENPFFSYIVIKNRISNIKKAKHGASLIDVTHTNATYYKPITSSYNGIEKLFKEQQ